MLLSTLFALALEILTILWDLAISIVSSLQMVKVRLSEDHLICPRLPRWSAADQTSNSGTMDPVMTLLAIWHDIMILVMGPFPLLLSHAAPSVTLCFPVFWQVRLFWWAFAVLQLAPT